VSDDADDEFHQLVDAITAYMGWVDLVIIGFHQDDHVLERRLRRLQAAHVHLLNCIANYRERR